MTRAYSWPSSSQPGGERPLWRRRCGEVMVDGVDAVPQPRSSLVLHPLRPCLRLLRIISVSRHLKRMVQLQRGA